MWPSWLATAYVLVIALLSLTPTSIAITYQMFDNQKQSVSTARALGLSYQYLYSQIVLRERRRQYLLGLGIALARAASEIAILLNFTDGGITEFNLTDQGLGDLANTLITKVKLENNIILILIIIGLGVFGKAVLFAAAAFIR